MAARSFYARHRERERQRVLRRLRRDVPELRGMPAAGPSALVQLGRIGFGAAVVALVTAGAGLGRL